jgi:hypothetical protein
VLLASEGSDTDEVRPDVGARRIEKEREITRSGPMSAPMHREEREITRTQSRELLQVSSEFVLFLICSSCPSFPNP